MFLIVFIIEILPCGQNDMAIALLGNAVSAHHPCSIAPRRR